MKRLIFPSLVLCTVLAVLRIAADDRAPYVPGEVLVVRSSRAYGFASGMRTIELSGRVERVATRPGQSVEHAIAELESRGDVIRVQPNYRYHANVIPNDPRYADQYHLALIGAPSAWDISRGSASETIAILDSGSDTDHGDLGARIVRVAGGDIVEGDDDAADAPNGTGHGTAVAGIAAAATNNGTQVAGIDWISKLLPIRILDTGGSASSFDIEAGIRKATLHRARVINMSIGYGDPSIDPLVEAALADAAAAGIIIVASAGNSATSSVHYPASSQYAIAAGSSTSADARSSFSNYGTGLDIMAPGSSLISIGLNDATVTGSGTSFSAPIISAAAALVRAIRPGLTPSEFLHFLRSTARDIGEAGWDDFTGPGRIDLHRLLTVATSKTDYGDSLPPARVVAGGHKGMPMLPMTSVDSFVEFGGHHYATRGTIEFYWMPEAAGGDSRFVAKQTDLDLVYQADGKLRYRLGGSTLLSRSKLNLNQWYHVALTYGDSGMILYVNGDSEVSNGSTAAPNADTFFLGGALGRFSALGFSSVQKIAFPSAMFIKVERPAALATYNGNILVGWKAYQTETTSIIVDIYADTDAAGYDGVLLASGLSNDQRELISLSALAETQSYFLYVIAREASSMERAYSYASSAIVPGENIEPAPGQAVTSGGGSAGGGGCIIARLPGDHTPVRRLRDEMMGSRAGRLLVRAYYSILSLE